MPWISLTLGTVTKLQIAVIRWNMETIIWVASSLDSEQNIGMITVVCPNVPRSYCFFSGGAGKALRRFLWWWKRKTRLTYELPDDGRLKVTMLHFHDGGKINSSVIRGAKTSCNLMPLRKTNPTVGLAPVFVPIWCCFHCEYFQFLQKKALVTCEAFFLNM